MSNTGGDCNITDGVVAGERIGTLGERIQGLNAGTFWVVVRSVPSPFLFASGLNDLGGIDIVITLSASGVLINRGICFLG